MNTSTQIMERPQVRVSPAEVSAQLKRTLGITMDDLGGENEVIPQVREMGLFPYIDHIARKYDLIKLD